jgi:hypothetical protein
MEDIIKKLEDLAQAMPDPFRMAEETAHFYTSKAAEELIAGGAKTVAGILDYIKNNPGSALISPAVLLLAHFDPELFYRELLNEIAACGNTDIIKFESGLWKIKTGEKEIAGDLFDLFYATGNPYILLLLQRPTVLLYKDELKKILESGKMPAALNALYCYRYALEKSDGVYLQQFLKPGGDDEANKLIKEYITEAKKIA